MWLLSILKLTINLFMKKPNQLNVKSDYNHFEKTIRALHEKVKQVECKIWLVKSDYTQIGKTSKLFIKKPCHFNVKSDDHELKQTLKLFIKSRTHFNLKCDYLSFWIVRNQSKRIKVWLLNWFLPSHVK